MKITLNKICRSVATATVLAFPIVLLASVQARAIDIPQRVTNGLFRSSSEDFFREGRRQFEREVQILQDRRLSSEEPILKTDDVRIQEQLSPLEMRNISPGGVDKNGSNKSRNFGTGRR
ncbi:hypothetical protein [Argonema galeatum]|uniref:hypothetical protein n=1 Tax=Argonema galeatum TaxID=2942762 RepID=UPI002010F465|nr:hypothetical protein [Argonema galeatum]MCL1467529.1 hypothetical protein [Argonema galeatum A003/A1]